MTKRRWQTDFEQVAAQIPAEWIVQDSDGFRGIASQHANDPLVKLYADLMRVGYAKGWI